MSKTTKESLAPDWSKAPDWAKWYTIDRNGMAYWHEGNPSLLPGESRAWLWNGRAHEHIRDKIDMKGLNWKVLKFSRPAEAVTELQSNFELKCREGELNRLAEEAWKAMLGNPHWSESFYQEIAKEAFRYAKAFIEERNKRRGA